MRHRWRRRSSRSGSGEATLARRTGHPLAAPLPAAMALLAAICLSWSAAVAPASGAAARAQLPRTFLDTKYVPPAGRIIRVHAGDDLRAALDEAMPGDQVVLDAGATFTGGFVLPKKPGTGVVVVRTSDLGALREGVRVGPADTSHLARLVAPGEGAALGAAPGAHGWRLVGIEFTVAPGVAENTGVVRLGEGTESSRSQLPREIVVDRSWVHGNSSQDDRRGVALNGIAEAVIDSTVSDFHEVGRDAQAIAGWNGPGPFKIVNDELQGAAENVMFGGADPAIDKIVPSDIEVRHNHFFKPLSWRVRDPSYGGIHWTVKNLFELKNARRVLVEGNVFENCWGDAQTGFAINLKSADQEGGAPWSVTQDVTFIDNVVRHAGAAVTVEGRDPGGAISFTHRVTIADDVFDDIDGGAWKGPGTFMQVLAGSRAPDGSEDGPADLIVDHDTAFQSGNVITVEGAPSRRFQYTNTITPHNRYGVKGRDAATGLDTLRTFFPGRVFTHNVLVHGDCSLYPPENFCPRTIDDVGFVDFAGGDYRLAASSPYHHAGTDGTDLGADIAVIEAATR